MSVITAFPGKSSFLLTERTFIQRDKTVFVMNAGRYVPDGISANGNLPGGSHTVKYRAVHGASYMTQKGKAAFNASARKHSFHADIRQRSFQLQVLPPDFAIHKGGAVINITQAVFQSHVMTVVAVLSGNALEKFACH